MTFQYHDVLLPFRVINPAPLNNAIPFFIVLSDRFGTLLNCSIVICGFRFIISNVLWATLHP